MKNMTCSKLCTECPFSNQSMPGYLADYDTQDILDMMNDEKTFICHLMLNETISFDKANELVQTGEMKMCRGYVEMFIRSCKMPKYNQLLKDCIESVKASGLSDNSMASWNFVKHHTVN